MVTEVLRQSRLPDPFRDGLAGGWKVIDASTLDADLTLEADVAIVGTGAGGGTAAEILSDAGLNVVLIEEGPLATSSDFRMREAEAYPQLYQESAGRKTRDQAINILQGRCVGGSTTVNWTSSFRTPPATLDYWAREFGITGFSPRPISHRGSNAWKRGSTFPPGRSSPTRTTTCFAAARRRWASRPARSGAT